MPNSDSPFQAIFFDFDGIILDSEWVIYSTWKDLYARHDQDLSLEIYTQCIGSGFHTWSPETHLESLTGKSFNWDQINQERQIKIEQDLLQAEPMQGIRDLLKDLSYRSIPVAIVSSSSHRWVDRWMNHFELTPFTNAIVCRGDAPKIKPAPDLYLKAADLLNVEPSQSLVIEDSLNGMQAAHSAGMVTAIIPNHTTALLDFSEARYQFKSASDLHSSLFRKNKICAL